MLTFPIEQLEKLSSVEIKKLEYIYVSTYDRALAYAISMLGNRYDAEDAVHDVYRSIAQTDILARIDVADIKLLQAYVCTATKNKCSDRKRSNDASQIILTDNIDTFCSDVSTDASLLESERGKMMLAAASVLDDYSKDILFFHIVYEMTDTQIAKILNKSRYSITRARNRAIAILKENMKEGLS
jgi:RNA polymerase sigma factor (sigma-70 family)